MAPEIVSRVEYCGPPSDIWASGVLLFCLLNGYFPFKGQSDAELYRRISRGAFKILRTDLSDECLSVMKEMLNVNADTRLSASELLQDNWFLTDSSKKRSIFEIKRQFKAKILEKFPVKNVNKNTICIPGQPVESKEDSGALRQNLVKKSEEAKQSTDNSKMTSSEGPESSDDAINKEALMAYYNTTGLPETNQHASPQLPLQIDLPPTQAVPTEKQDKQPVPNPAAISSFSPYIAFTQGNI